MSENGDARAHALSLVKDSSFQREAAQIQAKALLSEVADEVPSYRWTYLPHRVIRNAVLGTLDLQRIATQHPESIDGDLSDAARDLAMVWEHLARLREGTREELALLNAAVNYELAGYQANAAYLARSLEQNLADQPEPTLFDMSNLFLQRRLLQLRRLAETAQAEPEGDGGWNAQLVEALAKALAGSAFSHTLRFLLRGEKSGLEEAVGDLGRAESLYSSLHLVEETNLIRSIISLLPMIERRATWTLLPTLAPDRPKWRRYLKLLARGVGANLLKGSSITELWPSQIAAIEQGLLKADSSKVVKMPTSAGKTRIAELAIVHTLVNDPEARCVYVAPYRALVSELEQSLLNLLSDLGYRVSTVTGTYESDDFEDLLLRQTDVLVTTPEKLDLLFRTQPDVLSDARLFVLDEAQIVHEPRRGIKFELLIARLKNRLPEARFLTLSAVLPQETLEDFARWFNASPREDVLSSLWRPSIQRYAKLEWTGQTGVMRYAPDAVAREDVQILSQFVPGVIRQRVFEFVNPESSRINRRKFPDGNNKAQIAAELAYKFAELGPVLVFCSQPNFAKAVAKALQERLRLMSLIGENIPSYFEGNASTRSALLADEWLGDRSIVSLLQSGIGIHYGSLPNAVRSAVETDFRQRKLRVLVATNTLAQGVNLPVRTVVVHSVWRYVEDAQQRISAHDYWNAAGRAGRAGEETEGLIIHIATKERDEKDFRYYLDRRQNVEPIQSALLQRLVDLIQDRLSEEAFRTSLDPEILALLVEEGSQDSLDEVVREVLDGTLLEIQAPQVSLTRTQIDRLHGLFVEVANTIVERTPDPERRRVYSYTGLSTASCQAMANHTRNNRSRVEDLLRHGDASRLDEMIELLLSATLDLPEMQSNREVSASYADLLRGWMQGVAVGDLMNEFGGELGSPEELGSFIDDLFGYRLPWGASGYIRVASEVLGINPETMSEYVRFLPSMVKYGLPEVEACWAMSAGIPSRQVAIEVAAVYRREVETVDYEGFLEWLNDLNSERLHREFGLQSPVLEDVSRAIFISASNPTLRQLEDLEQYLPRVVDLRRIQYDNRLLAAFRVGPEEKLELVRDYDDVVDRNAIMVRSSGRTLGYLTRQTAQILAPEMDTGTAFDATIFEVESEAFPRVSVRITQRVGANEQGNGRFLS